MKTVLIINNNKNIKKTITFSIFTAILILIAGGSTIFAQGGTKKTETFKVYGNCDMCKETIEGALKKKDGVLKKEWSPKTKMLSVTFDESKISMTQIKQKIADVGYDTDEIKAKDETFNDLHKCCKYERAKK